MAIVASSRSWFKRRARGLSDRAVAPYLDDLERRIGHANGPGGVQGDGTGRSDVPSDLFHMMLHELRTIELERSRGDYRRVVSVGAQGRWYFDWFERSVGTVDEHVGVEAFEPEPSDLPAYARWIATTADRFEGIEDDDVDLVFAGQTTEHLWADELTGFLLQARRVLRTGGLLVLDSPNRLVTEHLHWSHGGHSVELSASEITELVELAGFKVDSIRGAWRCRFGDETFQLEERLDDGALLVRRIVDGPDNPDDCFVWWMVAHPAGDPKVQELSARCEELYDEHWPTRVCRGMWPGPGHEGPLVSPGSSMRVDSLPFMLQPGRWRISVRLAEGDLTDVVSAAADLALPGDHLVHNLDWADAVHVGADRIEWEFEQHELMFALTLTLRIEAGTRALRVAMPLDISRATS